jgi:signal transduction histidine kinase/pSer/pThr/pTyr-binding forkhead associated (FHA) protein/ActR/RegA family two-component response regulator
MIKLHILNGAEKDRSFELGKKSTYVGRSADNDIQLRDKHISRKHLKILLKRKTLFIRDLGSENGTFIGDEQIPAQKEIEVPEGVPVRIGNTVFSLGKAYPGAISPFLNPIPSSSVLQDTATLDRPWSTIKNFDLLYNASNVLMESLGLEETLDKLLECVFGLLKRIDRGAVILIDEKTGKIKQVVSRCAEGYAGNSTVFSRAVVNKVFKERKAVAVSDAFGSDGVDKSKSMEIMKIKSVMCVPLISKSSFRGVLYLDSVNSLYGFRKEDIALLTALSNSASIAIENAMLYSHLTKTIDGKAKSLIESEKERKENQIRFEAIFDNMTSGVVVYEVIDRGEEFLILDLNHAAQRIENIKRKSVLRKRAVQVFPWIERTGLLESLKRTVVANTPQCHTVQLGENSKASSWREYRSYNLPSGELVCICDDITDRKRAETEQKELQEQLLAAQKMESIGAFAGGTAHNFRNILQAISGNTEYLQLVCGQQQEVRELLNSIHQSVDKGVDLINGLLQFSRENPKDSLEIVDLNEIINESYRIVEKVLDRKVEIKLDLKEELFVKGNKSLLSQVFMNLFTNAKDAMMPQGGILHVEAEKKDSIVLASVSDTGCGMDKETQKRIFDPFFTMKEVGQGTGLGLSTSLGIVKQHGGTLSVYSEPGKGSTFRIILPLAEGRPLERANLAKGLRHGKGEKVLIVDDERMTLEGLSQLVESLGYKVIACDLPVKALQNYNRWGADVVLMDRSMPQMDGISCIRKIIETNSEARIIIVSGYEDSGPEKIDDDIRASIKGYLTKPVRIEELSREIFQALQA